MKTESLTDACRVRGSDPSVQSQCAAEISTLIPGSSLQNFNVTNAFKRAGLLKNHGDTASNLESLLVVSAGLAEIGDGVRIAQVIEYLGLAKAMTHIAIQLQRVSQCILSCGVVI